MTEVLLNDDPVFGFFQIKGLVCEPVEDRAVIQSERTVKVICIPLVFYREEVYPVFAPVLKLKKFAPGNCIRIGGNRAVLLDGEIFSV